MNFIVVLQEKSGDTKVTRLHLLRLLSSPTFWICHVLQESLSFSLLLWLLQILLLPQFPWMSTKRMEQMIWGVQVSAPRESHHVSLQFISTTIQPPSQVNSNSSTLWWLHQVIHGNSDLVNHPPTRLYLLADPCCSHSWLVASYFRKA